MANPTPKPTFAFVVRVELHKTQEHSEAYTVLHEELDSEKITRYAQSTSGKSLKLPHATYLFTTKDASITRDQVHAKAKGALSRTLAKIKAKDAKSTLNGSTMSMKIDGLPHTENLEEVNVSAK